MSACLDQTDVYTLSEATLTESTRRLETLRVDQCSAFYEEARSLELELLSVYRMVALCARKEDDLGHVSQWWKTMQTVCDSFAAGLHTLHEKHPACGAKLFYDRVLDLRNKCQRLAEMHS
jgi:rRNA maturation protein Nop10